jgi:hypothetical protein
MVSLSAWKMIFIRGWSLPAVFQQIQVYLLIILIIIIIFINCNWVDTRWQWSFNTYTKHDTGLLLNLSQEGYMRSM